MSCDCKWTNAVLGALVVIFTLWIAASWAQWVVVIAGVLVILHAFGCKNCGACETSVKSKAKAKKKK